MSKWHKFSALVKIFVPIVVASVNPKLAPVAESIADAINEAEKLPGASGPQKLKHVQEMAKSAVEVTNALGKTSIDVEQLDNAVDEVVTAGIKVVKVVHPPVDPTVKNNE